MDMLCKPVDWFLYDRDLRHKRVKIPSQIRFVLNGVEQGRMAQGTMK